VDGAQAVEHFIAHDDYDMIFMDIQMPRMDGLSATRRIRQLEAEHGRRPLPIIALTASALDEDVARALAAGCNLHISKPVKKRVLLDTIRTAAFISVTAQPPAPLAAAAALSPNSTLTSPVHKRNGRK
jgi:CheY-like chemotaxis protein